MSKKITPLQWLFDNLKSHFEHDGDLLEDVKKSFDIANEMDWKQKFDAYDEGVISEMARNRGFKAKSFADYYNETYGEDTEIQG